MADWDVMSDLDVLDREMYAEAEAARLLGVPQGTLHYWLEGGERRGRQYSPVLRPTARGSRSVTWAEFVEAALLREYRRTLNVPMAELRAFIELLRGEYGVPYPLADRRPFVVGRELVMQAQEQVGLDAEFCLVATVRGQLVLTPPSDAFLRRVTWEGDVAAGWRPHDDDKSPVRMSPTVRFGRPAVRGVSTEAIWEHDQGGEDVDEIAEAFDLDPGDVRWALAYETSARAS
jgi:uncharacterized protein (DUF433 family)